jgi:hypothetical protein
MPAALCAQGCCSSFKGSWWQLCIFVSLQHVVLCIEVHLHAHLRSRWWFLAGQHGTALPQFQVHAMQGDETTGDSTSGIHSYACSLVHSELSCGDRNALCICMSHICITAVTTALLHPIKFWISNKPEPASSKCELCVCYSAISSVAARFK